MESGSTTLIAKESAIVDAKAAARPWRMRGKFEAVLPSVIESAIVEAARYSDNLRRDGNVKSLRYLRARSSVEEADSKEPPVSPK